MLGDQNFQFWYLEFGSLELGVWNCGVWGFELGLWGWSSEFRVWERGVWNLEFGGLDSTIVSSIHQSAEVLLRLQTETVLEAQDMCKLALRGPLFAEVSFECDPLAWARTRHIVFRIKRPVWHLL